MENFKSHKISSSNFIGVCLYTKNGTRIIVEPEWEYKITVELYMMKERILREADQQFQAIMTEKINAITSVLNHPDFVSYKYIN